MNAIPDRFREFFRRFLLRFILGGVFVWAGAFKLLETRHFIENIRTFRLLPHEAVAPVAKLLPRIEIVAGICLITGILYRWGLGAISALLVLFLAAILSSWARGLDIHCGCFSASNNPSDYLMLVGRDIILLGIAAFLWRIELSHARAPCSLKSLSTNIEEQDASRSASLGESESDAARPPR